MAPLPYISPDSSRVMPGCSGLLLSHGVLIRIPFRRSVWIVDREARLAHTYPGCCKVTLNVEGFQRYRNVQIQILVRGWPEHVGDATPLSDTSPGHGRAYLSI